MAPLDRIVASTDLVTVGAFRCPVDHPQFVDSGPIRQACIVFPRTSVRIAHEGRRAFVADPSTVTMYNAGQRYRREAVSGDGDRCDWFAFAPSLLRDVTRAIDPRSSDVGERVITRDHAWADLQLYRRQRRLFLAASAGRLDPIAVDEGAIDVLRGVLWSAPGSEGPSSRRTVAARRRADLADAARVLIGRRFRSRLSLSALASAIGCSPFDLCRSFRSVTGTTIHAHLIDLRLRASLERLEARVPITDIALDVGFSSHSHFTEAFRRHFGTPPSRVARFR